MIGLFVGMAALAAALGLGAWALLGRTTVVAGVRLDGPRPAGADLPQAHAVSGLQQRMAALAARLGPADYAQRSQHRLDLAGNPRTWGPDRVLALKGSGLVFGLVFGLVLGAKQGGVWAVLVPAVLGAAGLYLPDIWTRNLGEKRQIELQKGLPDALDMMTVCVEAGLGFDAALGRVARNLEGPMAQECARVLQEMQFGMSRTEALRSLIARTDVAELRVFVSAIVQSSELGISIGDVLREQAKQMRVKRRHRAEEKAQKLQVKLLFPLISCLLPAMFIIVLGPAGIQIFSFFSNANR